MTASLAEEFTLQSSAGGVRLAGEPPAVEVHAADVLDQVGYLTDAERFCEEHHSLFVGYDQGFVVANDGQTEVDGGAFPFLIRINSWFQLRHTGFNSQGPNQDQNTFSFERLRFSFAGHAFSPDLNYFFQFDGNSDRATDAIFLDYYATYDVGRALLGLDRDRLGLKFGQWKVPFSRSREESGRRLQFTDRATANVFFDLNRSVGVGAYGELSTPFRPIKIETALFNGYRSRGFRTNRDGGLDQNFGWSLRAFSDLGSEFGNDGEPDLTPHRSPTLRTGGGLAYTRVGEEGQSEFSRARVVDSGATLLSLLPPGVDAYDVWYFTTDLHWKYRGWSVILDYYWRAISNFSGGAVPDLGDHGFVAQTGYFVVPERFEILARWSRIVGDSGTLGRRVQSSDEIGGGIAWYFRGHHAKFVFDATHVNGVPIQESRLDMLPGDAGWFFRSQLQLAF
jgi:hypothetical protein